MKKIFIFLVLLNIFLVSCQNRFSLEQTIYIDSIALDYNKETNKYVVYYHIATSQTLLSAELGTSDNSYSIGHAEGDSVYDAVKEIKINTTKNISLTHIQSFIFSKNYVTQNNFKTFVDDVKTYDLITPNFYCFYTEDDLNKIYSLENPENISTFFSIITSTDFITTYQLIYFTNIARSVCEEYIILKLIGITLTESIWQNEDEPIITIKPDGDFYLNKDDTSLYLKVKDFPALTIYNNDYASDIIYDSKVFTVYDQNFKVTEKDNIFSISIKGNVYASNLSYNNYEETIAKFNSYIEDEMQSLFKESQNKSFDIFNLQDILYRKGKLKDDFDYKAVQVNFHCDYKIIN